MAGHNRRTARNINQVIIVRGAQNSRPPTNSECYERTQHLIENKDTRFWEPSNSLMTKDLTERTQQVSEKKRLAVSGMRTGRDFDFSGHASFRWGRRACYDSRCSMVSQPQGHMSGFGRCATDAREPRQVRKEATVASLSVCRSHPKSGAQIADFRLTIFKSVRCPWSVVRCTRNPSLLTTDN
jgi:hypothetical protein